MIPVLMLYTSILGENWTDVISKFQFPAAGHEILATKYSAFHIVIIFLILNTRSCFMTKETLKCSCMFVCFMVV